MRKSPIGLMQRIAAGRGVLSARAQQIGKNLIPCPLYPANLISDGQDKVFQGKLEENGIDRTFQKF